MYNLIWAFSSTFVPIPVIFFLYARVLQSLWFQKDSRAQQGILKARKKVTKTLLTVTVIYVLSWTPPTVLYLLDYVPGHKKTLYNVSMLFVMLNSSANPLVYTLQSRQFRRHLWNYLLCKEDKNIRNGKRNVRPNNKDVVSGKRGTVQPAKHINICTEVQSTPVLLFERKEEKETIQFAFDVQVWQL